MGGTLFQPQPQLTLLDAQGNVVPSTGATATATLVAGPAGFAASDLIGPATASFVGGYAQFSGLKINKWVLTVGTRGGGGASGGRAFLFVAKEWVPQEAFKRWWVGGWVGWVGGCVSGWMRLAFAFVGPPLNV